MIHKSMRLKYKPASEPRRGGCEWERESETKIDRMRERERDTESGARTIA